MRTRPSVEPQVTPGDMGGRWRIWLMAVFMAVCTTAANAADNYDAVFADSTLRVDYILGGNPARPGISFYGMSKSAGWSGRQHDLSRLPLKGNGRLTITDAVNSDTVFVTSFSTLYNEWLTLGDTVPTAFEHTVLAPLPKKAANIELTINDGRGQPLACHRTIYDPAQKNVRRRKPSPYTYNVLHDGAYTGTRINVAILPEGFTAGEMERFDSLARVTVANILKHKPFAEYADRFTFRAVHVPSADSGVSVPRLADWRETAFGSHFSTFDSDRYLTSPKVFAIHDALSGIPAEHIIILANVDEYGGGGIYNSYTLTTTGHKDFGPVVVHEFGHSMGGLADEYFYDQDVMTDTYPQDIEPWEQNITTLVDFTGKWGDILPEGTPVPTPESEASKYPAGVYEGGGYSSRGIYRPAVDCRMRTNTAAGFCPGCVLALRRLIEFLTEE